MEILEAIHNRRTIKDFKPDAVSDELLERALEAGIWAQNHRMTQPWRFAILGAQTHRALAQIYGETQVRMLPENCTDEQREQARAKGEAKLLSKPRIVAVGSTLASDAEQRREDYAAVCCAIQNIQLAAWNAGLGMQWSTGKAMTQPATYELLQMNPADEEIIGLLYFGVPATIPAPLERKSLQEVLRRFN